MPFFYFGVPPLKPNARKEGTLIISGVTQDPRKAYRWYSSTVEYWVFGMLTVAWDRLKNIGSFSLNTLTAASLVYPPPKTLNSKAYTLNLT